MGPQIELVGMGRGLVPAGAATIGKTRLGACLAGALQETILKIVEGAHARDMAGVKAADECQEWIVAHEGDPNVEASVAT
jgi:hypothetical protein